MDFRRFGGPTLLFEFGGLTFLTDPTFDAPGDYPVGARTLTKTAPALAGPPAGVDVVLLSHDQHPDNLDTSGRAFLSSVPRVLTTTTAAQRLGPPATGLDPWEHTDVAGVRITAVPAQHGPDGTEHLTGPVIGFVLDDAVYVSGDNASPRIVEQVAERFPGIEVAVLFGGAARNPLLGAADLTLNAAGLVEAVRVLKAGTVVPVHVDSWAHLTQSIDDVHAAFAEAGLTHVLA